MAGSPGLQPVAELHSGPVRCRRIQHQPVRPTEIQEDLVVPTLPYEHLDHGAGLLDSVEQQQRLGIGVEDSGIGRVIPNGLLREWPDELQGSNPRLVGFGDLTETLAGLSELDVLPAQGVRKTSI